MLVLIFMIAEDLKLEWKDVIVRFKSGSGEHLYSLLFFPSSVHLRSVRQLLHNTNYHHVSGVRTKQNKSVFSQLHWLIFFLPDQQTDCIFFWRVGRWGSEFAQRVCRSVVRWPHQREYAALSTLVGGGNLISELTYNTALNAHSYRSHLSLSPSDLQPPLVVITPLKKRFSLIDWLINWLIDWFIDWLVDSYDNFDEDYSSIIGRKLFSLRL